MTTLLARLRVLLTAAPTWIVAASTIVVALSEEIGRAFPAVSDELGAIAAVVLAALAAAHQIVRRVSPVLKIERGLLPKGGTPGEAG